MRYETHLDARVSKKRGQGGGDVYGERGRTNKNVQYQYDGWFRVLFYSNNKRNLELLQEELKSDAPVRPCMQRRFGPTNPIPNGQSNAVKSYQAIGSDHKHGNISAG